MPLNKVGLVINSRLYTVVSDESVEYMEMLGEHINEKVNAVIKDGRHIMGERPIVLAALNICDEYYKLLEKKSQIDLSEMSQLKEENAALRAENLNLLEENEKVRQEKEKIEQEGIEAAQTEAIAKIAALQKELEEANTQVKFLEGKLKEAELKNEKMKQEHDRRETEIIEMFGEAGIPKPTNRAERRAVKKNMKRK